MITEKEYCEITDITHRKRFAQFFTPERIADFMTRWVLSDCHEGARLLEPAFGLGVFSRCMARINPSVRVVGYETDERIANFAQNNFSTYGLSLTINVDDYIMSPWDERYDGIICNPPYLKFHDYDNSRYIPIVNKHLNIRLNGFTNLYTLFLLKSICQLRDNGRMAYIVPSEFLNSDYGVEVKRALLESGTLKHIIVVDFKRTAFDDALTTACILLCEKGLRTDNVRFSTIEDIDDIDSALTNYVSVDATQLKPELKWRRYYGNMQSEKYRNLVPFSTFAKVSRGIATGANDYFTFRPSKKNAYGIPDCCMRPCICHAVDVKGNVFTADDFRSLSRNDRNVYLFNGCADNTNTHVQDYLQLGEKSGIDKKYLTSSRHPWYVLENRKPAPIWVSVFNRNGLRFIRNKANVYNLTTFHCVYNIGEIDTDVLFAYLITDTAKEIFLDNSRQYGNGLIKFEPNDLNKGCVVDLRLLSEEEKSFVIRVYDKSLSAGGIETSCIRLLDSFFREKYTVGIKNLASYSRALESC